MSTQTVHYTLIDAFTTKVFGGNPASIVLVGEEDEYLSAETMQLIAREFNLPMTAFLKKLASDGCKFSLRWFNAGGEVPICGHATLGSAAVLFSKPALVPSSINTIHFETAAGILTAQNSTDGKISLELPAGQLAPVSSEIEQQALPLLKEAFGLSKIKSLHQGLTTSFNHWLVVEVDQDDKIDLGKIEVKKDVLARIASHPAIGITTKIRGKEWSSTAADSINEDFQCRAFMPRFGVPEDYVCGALNCLLGPYWSNQFGDSEMSLISRQVSSRGGVLEIEWRKDKGTVVLKGHVTIVGRGELFI